MQSTHKEVSVAELEKESLLGLSEVQESLIDSTSLASYYFRALEIIKQLQIYEECPHSHEFSLLHAKCLNALITCASKVSENALFVEGRNIDQVPTTSLQFMRIDYLLADLISRTPINYCNVSEFRYGSVLKLVINYSLRFAGLLHSYGLNEDKAFDNIIERMMPEGPCGKLKIDLGLEFSEKEKKAKKRLMSQHERSLDHSLQGHTRDARFPTLRNTALRKAEILRLKINFIEARFMVERVFDQARAYCASSEECTKYLYSEDILSPSPVISDELLKMLFNSPIMRPAQGVIIASVGAGHIPYPVALNTNQPNVVNDGNYVHTSFNEASSVYGNRNFSAQYTNHPVVTYRLGYKNTSLLEPGLRFDDVGPPSFPDGIINRPFLVTEKNMEKIYNAENVEDPLDGVEGKETLRLADKFGQCKRDLFADIEV